MRPAADDDLAHGGTGAHGGDDRRRLTDERRRRQHREADEQPGGHLEGRRFDVVHTLIDCVPAGLRRAMLDHSLAALVAPGGRLVVSHYSAPPGGRTDEAGMHGEAIAVDPPNPRS
jgi:hypothetical protein